MKLSDLFRDVDLSAFGTVALLLFLSVFVGVLVRTFLRSRRADDHLASLPLDDDRQETLP